MDVMTAIEMRRSNRQYKADPIPTEVLNQCLEAMRLAPSGSNRQPWRFVVVVDEKVRQALQPACNNQPSIGQAPVVIAACALPGTSEKGAYINLAIPLEHLALIAVELGLGTCWIGAYKEDEVKKVLGIPEDVRVVELMTLGYPADQPAPRPRKSAEEIFCYNKW